MDAVRSPMGKGKAATNGRPGGALCELHPVELLAQTLRALMDRNPGVDPGEVEDVLTGCVSQAGEQAGCPGRWAWLGAGLPEHVPSVTIDRRCGSSQQAADFAAQGVIAGVYDVAVACGVESMSRIPMGTARLGQDVYGPSATERYAPRMVPQGISAELIASRFGLDRCELDVFSSRSHESAAAADFAREIVPINVGEAVVEADETPRPQTTVEGLGELEPVFASQEMAELDGAIRMPPR